MGILSMPQRIKSGLKKWPLLYLFLRNLWHGFRKILETYVLGSKVQEWAWKTRHFYKGRGWAEGYLRSTNHPHRVQIVEAVSSFYPFKTVLELGCSAGPNLLLLAQKYPEAWFIGIDINASAIRKGNEFLHSSNIKNISLSTGKVDALSRFADNSMDVVFTDAVLMFVGGDKIYNVLKEMGRIASKGLIFNEYHSGEVNCHKYDGGRWVHNFDKILRSCFPVASIQFKKSIFSGGAWDSYGTLITVTL